MSKFMLIAVVAASALVGACTIKEEKTVAAPGASRTVVTADGTAVTTSSSTSTTTSTRVGF